MAAVLKRDSRVGGVSDLLPVEQGKARLTCIGVAKDAARPVPFSLTASEG